jgi:hypothetical protein
MKNLTLSENESWWELASESLYESFLNSHVPVKREQELHESWWKLMRVDWILSVKRAKTLTNSLHAECKIQSYFIHYTSSPHNIIHDTKPWSFIVVPVSREDTRCWWRHCAHAQYAVTMTDIVHPVSYVDLLIAIAGCDKMEGNYDSELEILTWLQTHLPRNLPHFSLAMHHTILPFTLIFLRDTSWCI